DLGRRALAEEGSRVLSEGMTQEVQEDKEFDAVTRWNAKWGSRKRFDSMIQAKDNWDEAVFRLVIAIRTGTVISQSWCQTDRIDAIPEAILSLA
ncbi:UNVERIFIED_CONTAM: hypothetical protein NY603_21635, partial [Bacteroidetes bacterium 56_B9]